MADEKMNDHTFVKNVITFYESHGRHSLSWRKKITPYRILVSEVMLQQTQVARVEKKFDEWMRIYPTLAKLQKASLQDVLLLWQGLGYQRRVKALLKISNMCRSVPRTFDELVSLPGIGTYTASAICAFAYNIFTHPVLETNIRTALIEHYYKEGKVSDLQLYEDLYRLERLDTVLQLGARNWYYALMDYGAFLKQQGTSHNIRSSTYRPQSVYKGSIRQLRAKVLFSLARSLELPKDDARLQIVLDSLIDEGFIIKNKSRYLLSS